MEAKPSPEPKTGKPHSADNLDRLVTVTSPAGWLALLACWVLIGTALIWGIWGSVPTKASGGGLLMHTGGVLEVVTRGPGQILALNVREGDLVQTGQVVARITQPDLDVKIASTRRELASLHSQYEHLQKVFAREWELKVANFRDQRRNLHSQLGDIGERERWLTRRQNNQQGLLDKGLITEKTLFDTKIKLQNAKEERRKTLLNLEKINEDELRTKSQQQRDLFNNRQKILETENHLALLIEQLAYQTNVKSEFSGRVLEIAVRVGDQLQGGNRIFSMEPLQPELRSVVYIPSGQGGKKVEPGMKVQISPATVKRDEFGFILGRVTWVSPYPATKESMLSILGNEGLVKQFSKDTPPIVVHADLITDPHTPSGLKWSSREGPPFRITAGTLVSGEIVVREQRPISLVIPYLKKFFGL
ncbi:MAG: NHLP bacteriocin system secretion protein [Syntrophales bacterium]|nr:NHLP bacteriocin system secretion protein [Syntrophales bacterium]MDD5640194.1 NHLP bacteriocin system secretion protein [Syntrophales bacterium]